MALSIRRYTIVLGKKAEKNLRKLPKDILQRFLALAEDLREKGPVAHNWEKLQQAE